MGRRCRGQQRYRLPTGSPLHLPPPPPPPRRCFIRPLPRTKRLTYDAAHPRHQPPPPPAAAAAAAAREGRLVINMAPAFFFHPGASFLGPVVVVGESALVAAFFHPGLPLTLPLPPPPFHPNTPDDSNGAQQQQQHDRFDVIGPILFWFLHLQFSSSLSFHHEMFANSSHQSVSSVV